VALLRRGARWRTAASRPPRRQSLSDVVIAYNTTPGLAAPIYVAGCTRIGQLSAETLELRPCVRTGETLCSRADGLPHVRARCSDL
jgi:hypothetical protein